MHGSRCETALALLFAGQGNPRIEKKAKRIFEQELSKALGDDRLTALLHTGLLINGGILEHSYIGVMSKYVMEVHNMLRNAAIHKGIENRQLCHLLFSFLVLSLYKSEIDKKEYRLLDRIGQILREKLFSSGDFVTTPITRLCNLYMVTSRLNFCTQCCEGMAQDVLSLHRSCKMMMDASMSTVVKDCLGTGGTSNEMNVCDYQFKHIMTVREMTDCVLCGLVDRRMALVEKFLSKDFLTENYLSAILPRNELRFSLSHGISRILMTYALASEAILDRRNSSDKTAMYLLAI